MTQTFDQLVREFQALVAFQLSGKGETISPAEKQEVRRQIGKLVDAVATMVVGLPAVGMNRLTMEQTVDMMTTIRRDMFEKFDEAGIGYSQYVQGGCIAVQLTDKETGTCVYRGVTDRYDEAALLNYMKKPHLEHVSVH